MLLGKNTKFRLNHVLRSGKRNTLNFKPGYYVINFSALMN